MTRRICHTCATSGGHIGLPPTGSVSGTNYQLKKIQKHTTTPPAGSEGLVSVFATGSMYADYIVNAMLSGSVEFDDKGRKNIVWYAGAQNGCVYVSGTVAALTDGVKVVLSDNGLEIHAFPTGVLELRVDRCAECGGPLV